MAWGSTYRSTKGLFLAAVMTPLVMAGCGAGSDVGGASDDTSLIDGIDDVQAARELWAMADTDAYRLTLEGEVGGQSASLEVVVADGRELIRNGFPETGDFGIEAIFDRFGEAFSAGRAASGSYDRTTGLPVDIDVEAADGQPDIDVRVLDFEALEQPEGCVAETGSIIDIEAEPIEYIGRGDRALRRRRRAVVGHRFGRRGLPRERRCGAPHDPRWGQGDPLRMTRGTTHVVVVGLDGRLGTRCAGYTGFMLAIVILIAILLLFGILGAVVKGLLWLTFIAAVLVVGAAAYGWWKFKRAGSH